MFVKWSRSKKLKTKPVSFIIQVYFIKLIKKKKKSVTKHTVYYYKCLRNGHAQKKQQTCFINNNKYSKVLCTYKCVGSIPRKPIDCNSQLYDDVHDHQDHVSLSDVVLVVSGL